MSIDNRNYYVVQAWMVNDLGLQGDELTVFAILWGFSQDGKTECQTSLTYFMDWLGCAKHTIIDIIKSLVEKGYIEVNKGVGVPNTYKVVQNLHQCKNCTGSSAATAPVVVQELHHYNNNINNIINKRNNAREEYKEINDSFETWWSSYDCPSKTGKGGCYSYWETLDADERAQVIEHTKAYIQKSVTPLQPYAYLVKFQYWRNEKPQRYTKTEKAEPKCDMVTAYTGKAYVAVPREEAIANKWEIVNDGNTK